MLLTYPYSPILVDISDTVAGTTLVKRRARRANVSLPDNATTPCQLDVEVIPYACLPDGAYGEELTGGVFTRARHTIGVSNLRLVDAATGQILASRYRADNSLRPDADWQAEVDRLTADETVQAMYQSEWFCKIMREVPAVVDEFIIQYIQLADASGDLG